MAEGFVVRRETHVPAPPATVFAFFTDPEKLIRWMGNSAVLEPHPDGLYLLKDIAGRATARGTFKEVVPVHRLVYSFGWDHSTEVPAGSSLVEIDLEERDNGTLVRFTHSGLPNEHQRAEHEKGWTHYIGRLTRVLSGEAVEPDRRPQPAPDSACSA
jgi:uncharacterized protein YndB with AHSA1/START domain